MALQIRRGLDSDRGTVTPLVGEPVWTTDTKKLYVGDGTTAGGHDIVAAGLASVGGHIVPETDSTYDLGDSSKKFRDLYLSGNSIYLGDNLILRNDGGVFKATDSSNTAINISLTANTTSDLAEGNNLYYTTTRSDSDFDVRLTTKTADNLSEGSTNLYFTNARVDARVDSAYVQARQTAGGNDSATTIALIDSAYVQARQTTTDLTNYRTVTQIESMIDSNVNAVIDAAPGALDTLNELAAALGDDANFSTTVTNSIAEKIDSAQAIAIIDSAYVQARQTTYDFLDSAETIALIDSAYVTARAGTGTDSATVSAIIVADVDSAYVQARQTAGGGGNDSATTIALIDSDYIKSRSSSAFTKILISGQNDVIADTSEATILYNNTTQQAKLQSSTFNTNDDFGRFLDLAGDRLIVGAATEDTGSYSNNGAAFVFKRTDSSGGTGWAEEAILTAASTQNSNSLGNAVQLNDSANVALVGGGSVVGDGFVIEYERLTNFKLSTASYDNVSSSAIDVGSQAETAVACLMFNNDGTKLYYLGNSAKRIYQFSLGSAYDVTDMTYDNASFSVSSQAGNAPRDMKFSNDGTKLFVSDWQNGRIYQYSLSTAYDISTASYDSVSLFVSSQDAGVQGFAFKPDGTKLFVVTNSNDNMYQYTLSTGYDLSTASYDSVSFNSGAFASNDQRQMQISTDGKKLFVMGYSNDAVYQINLTTAYDLSTASTSNYASFGVGGQESLPYAVVFNNDGSKMFIAGQGNDIIYQYSTDGVEWREGQTIADPGTTGTDKKYVRYGNLEISGGAGNYFVGGAEDDDDGGTNKGSAWVYYKDSDGGSWSLQQEISDSARGDNSDYGKSLSFGGDSIIAVGAPGYNTSGGVFIWERTGSSWARTQLITRVQTSSATENFGWDVSISGNYLAISRTTVSIDGNNNVGDVHIYYKNGSTFEYQDTVVASDRADGHYFGSNIDLRGDTLLVSAYGNTKSYIFTRSGTSWTQQKAFTGDDSPNVFGGDRPSGAKINKDTTKNDLAVGGKNRGAYVFTAPAAVTMADTLTLQAGSNITLTTSSDNDLITISTSALDATSVQPIIDSSITATVDSAYVSARVLGWTAIDSSLSTADSAQVIDSFAATTYRTTKYIAQLRTEQVNGYTDWPNATEQQIITGSEAGAPDTIGNNDEFGRGIAIGSNKLLVGSTRNDYGTTDAGAAVYYTRDSAAGTWTYQQWVQPSSPGASDFFGQAIAADSAFDTIAVTGHTEGLFILDRSNDSDNTTWSQTYENTPSATAYSNAFQHVAISRDGETAITGVHYDTNETGKAYVYAKDSSGGTWSLQATLTASNAGTYDHFGKSVALGGGTAGNVAAVAAPQEDTAGTNKGAIYVFNRSGSTWTQESQILTAGSTSALLGNQGALAVSADGNYIYAGSYGETISNAANTGAVYVFNNASNYTLISASYDNVESPVLYNNSDLGTLTETSWTSMAFNPDGTKMYALGYTTDKIHQFALSTAYDVSSSSISYVGTHSSSFNTLASNSTPQDFKFNNDGTKVFVTDSGTSRVYEYDLSTAYDITTLSYNSVNFFHGSQGQYGWGLEFNSDGSKMYVWTGDNAYLVEYNLSTNFSLSSVSHSQSKQFPGYKHDGMVFSPDGTKLFGIYGPNTNNIYQWNLTSAYDISTIETSPTRQLSTSGQDSNSRGIAFNGDGTKIFMIGMTNDKIHRYSTTGTEWIVAQKLTADDGAGGAKFGSSLALDGSNLIIGAEGANTYGGAYLFTQGTDGSWTQRKKVSPSDGTAASNKFGGENGVAISGKDAAVGAWNYPTAKGRAYVYNTPNQNVGFRAAKNHSEEILLMHDGTNVAMTSYAKLVLDSDLGTFDGVISGGNTKLTLSPTYANTIVKLKAIRTEA
jgi:sugar lactone lactonase YvrE